MIKAFGKCLEKPHWLSLSLFCCLLPLIFMLGHAIYHHLVLQTMEDNFQNVKEFAENTAFKRKNKRDFLLQYTAYDPYYITHQIESFELMKKEKEELKKILYHSIFKHENSIHKMKEKLESNHLHFTEELISQSKLIKETKESQNQEVMANFEDILHLLSQIEGTSINELKASQNSPQLILTKFSMKRLKNMPSLCFKVNSEILKREFLKKVN